MQLTPQESPSPSRSDADSPRRPIAGSIQSRDREGATLVHSLPTRSLPYGRGPDHGAFRRAFTLIEMVVSVGILVIVILAVGVIFQAAGRAVGVSQASMEMLSNDRAIQQQLESDVSGIDKNAFLVIRSATYTDPGSGVTRRCDQISFISRGSFPNRAGTTSSTPFTDNFTTAPAAFIWWGQPAFESSASSSASGSTDPRISLPTDSTQKVPLSQIPTGTADTNGMLEESSLALGREAMLLVPPSSSSSNIAPNGTSVASYPNETASEGNSGAAIDYDNTATPTANSTFDSAGADITQSCIDIAQCTPNLLMSYLMQGINLAGGRATVPRYEADHYCYRHAALRSPYDGTGTPAYINGYFRMHPIALQGVSSFIVEWTDGSPYVAGDIDPISGRTVSSGDALIGTTRWYGYGNPKAGSGATLDGPVGGTGNTNGDSYCAIFSYDNRTQWPVALRFRYHVVDASGRLPNGRDFTEVVKLPN